MEQCGQATKTQVGTNKLSQHVHVVIKDSPGGVSDE
jgi:hypothetical protein